MQRSYAVMLFSNAAKNDDENQQDFEATYWTLAPSEV